MYKILVFGMTENPGGVESVIMNYYHYMDKNTFHFDFLCNSYNKIAFEEEIISNGSQTFHFPARSKNYKKYKKELKNFFENNASKYDAIWVNVCSLANIDYLKMAKKYGIKRRIIHSHNSQNMDSRLRGILHKYNKKRIAYYVTDFWSCSKEASEWFYDSSIIKKSIIISNAIDVEKYCFDDVKRKKLRRDLKWEENYIIGNIGRLHFQKNQMFILDIFEKLIKKEPKVRLILIGDGEDKTKLEKEIDKKKLNKYVYMAGIQKDICGWLSTFDLFLFPSKFEGLSMAAMEAQAKGPVIIAGALSKHKAGYIYNLPENCNFNLYGINFEREKASSNTNYVGAFNPEELIYNLQGSFGLVWDGDSSATCTGVYGDYLKINNPHKTSMYLAAGIPVIIWEEAALANFIKKNHCGITIKSTDEIRNIIDNMLDEEYETLKANACKIGGKLRRGYFLKSAMKQSI